MVSVIRFLDDVSLRFRGLPPTEMEYCRSKTNVFEQEIALHQVLRERDFYGVPRNVSGTDSPDQRAQRPFVVQLCTVFFGLKDEALTSEVLEDQENS